jgi:preprotein translocase subunit SecE
MKHTKTCPALVPPPPVPPSRTAIAAASPEPSRQPFKAVAANSFLEDVLYELKHVAWPTCSMVGSMSCVVVGLLCIVTVYVFTLQFVVGTVFRAIGL